MDEVNTGKKYAEELDEKDPLSEFRNRYIVPDDVVYLDGNSLGLISVDAEECLDRVVDEWKELGIKGWKDAEIPWIWYGERLGDMTAPLIGAEEDEVVVSNCTTVNIHTLIGTFYDPFKGRKKIIVDELDFPTDHYAIKAQMRLKEVDPEENLIVVESRDGRTIDEEDVVDRMEEDVAIVFLPSVLYRSGQLLDIEYITEEAHKRDILAGFDLAHSIGVCPHKLDEWEVDFAVWCNYKYLNSGPGAIAGLYVNEKHFDSMPALAGWWGHEKSTQFDMNLDFTPAEHSGAWQIGTIPILSSAPLEGSLRIIREAGVDRIRKKSVKLTSYLISLVDKLLREEPYNFRVGTPRDAESRGGHVAIERDKEAYRINRAMINRGFITDFRPPNIIRVCPSPLYTRYVDVWRFIDNLKEVVQTGEYEKFEQEGEEIVY